MEVAQGNFTEEEWKFNADVSHDMLMVRKERKDFLSAQAEKRRIDQEKLDKKRNKKWFWIISGMWMNGVEKFPLFGWSWS